MIWYRVFWSACAAIAVLVCSQTAFAQQCGQGQGQGAAGMSAGGFGGASGFAGSGGNRQGQTRAEYQADQMSLMQLQLQLMSTMPQLGTGQRAMNPTQVRRKPRAQKNLMSAYQRRLYEIAKREERRKRLRARL